MVDDEIDISSLMQIPSVDYATTICSVCGGSEEEDLVLLCDGPGCTSEIHMYCLKPLVTAVPEGDWFCPSCDINGTTLHLDNLLQSQKLAIVKGNLENKNDYQQYLVLLQQNYYSFKDWRPNNLECRVSSEFDISASYLIGMPIRIHSAVEDQVHIGRIISRKCDYNLGRWEHLVQFKRYKLTYLATTLVETLKRYLFCKFDSDFLIFHLSGADGRNRSLIEWLCIEEHSCSVGGDVVWGKVQGFAWWPAQHYFRSGIEIIRKGVEAQALSSYKSATGAVCKSVKTPLLLEPAPISSISSMLSLSNQAKADIVYLCFFLEDTHLEMSIKEAKATVVPFCKRNKEVRSGMAKRLNTAYTLAVIELEEQRSTLCAHKYLSTVHLETYGGLADGSNVHHLQKVAEAQALIQSQQHAQIRTSKDPVILSTGANGIESISNETGKFLNVVSSNNKKCNKNSNNNNGNSSIDDNSNITQDSSKNVQNITVDAYQGYDQITSAAHSAILQHEAKLLAAQIFLKLENQHYQLTEQMEMSITDEKVEKSAAAEETDRQSASKETSITDRKKKENATAVMTENIIAAEETEKSTVEDTENDTTEDIEISNINIEISATSDEMERSAIAVETDENATAAEMVLSSNAKEAEISASTVGMDESAAENTVIRNTTEETVVIVTEGITIIDTAETVLNSNAKVAEMRNTAEETVESIPKEIVIISGKKVVGSAAKDMKDSAATAAAEVAVMNDTPGEAVMNITEDIEKIITAEDVEMDTNTGETVISGVEKIEVSSHAVEIEKSATEVTVSDDMETNMKSAAEGKRRGAIAVDKNSSTTGEMIISVVEEVEMCNTEEMEIDTSVGEIEMSTTDSAIAIMVPAHSVDVSSDESNEINMDMKGASNESRSIMDSRIVSKVSATASTLVPLATAASTLLPLAVGRPSPPVGEKGVSTSSELIHPISSELFDTLSEGVVRTPSSCIINTSGLKSLTTSSQSSLKMDQAVRCMQRKISTGEFVCLDLLYLKHECGMNLHMSHDTVHKGTNSSNTINNNNSKKNNQNDYLNNGIAEFITDDAEHKETNTAENMDDIDDDNSKKNNQDDIAGDTIDMQGKGLDTFSMELYDNANKSMLSPPSHALSLINDLHHRIAFAKVGVSLLTNKDTKMNTDGTGIKILARSENILPQEKPKPSKNRKKGSEKDPYTPSIPSAPGKVPRHLSHSSTVQKTLENDGITIPPPLSPSFNPIADDDVEAEEETIGYTGIVLEKYSFFDQVFKFYEADRIRKRKQGA